MLKLLNLYTVVFRQYQEIRIRMLHFPYYICFKCSKFKKCSEFHFVSCFIFLSKHKGSLQTEFFLKKLSNKDLKALHWQLYWENWNVCILGLEQLRKSSGSLKTISSDPFESLWSHYINSWLFWSTERFNESLFIILSQFVTMP